MRLRLAPQAISPMAVLLLGPVATASPLSTVCVLGTYSAMSYKTHNPPKVEAKPFASQHPSTLFWVWNRMAIRPLTYIPAPHGIRKSLLGQNQVFG